MWCKCKELFEKGLSKRQISRELCIDRKTVKRYLRMNREEFGSSAVYQRHYRRILDPYESYVRTSLEAHPELSSSQIYDWLRERYSNLPNVSIKTVYNYTQYIRAKYGILRPNLTNPRQYMVVEETPYGEYAQVDFGETWMHYEDGRRVKIYFFAMVLCRSRKKYVWFSKTPFTSELAIYAHEKAFEYYGGKPLKIIYDQDKVFIHDENFGDYILTNVFGAFVNSERFETIFCHKSDPESKGKVENVVKYVKNNFLRCRTFVSIGQLNEEGVRWLSRTANGLPHCGTRLVPDEVFEEERKHLAAYNGVPKMPERQMREYKVHKTNAISYCGNEYSLPSGSYRNPDSRVWVDIKGSCLYMYDKETGKQVAHHVISEERGKYIVDPSHRIRPKVGMSNQENDILSYCNHDELAIVWCKNLKADKPRYYRDNLRYFVREMRHFEPATLHGAFDKCLEAGMYNAKDFIALCDRIGKRIPIRESSELLHDILPDVVKESPEKTKISTYNQYFL
ncbi:MAG: IS21 family transposase [Paludibacteraceae bacterium]|nr:IS21 family transposase [Paludibacteraceae bacterium]